MRSSCTGPCGGTICHQRSAQPGNFPAPPQVTALRPICQTTIRRASPRSVTSRASAGSTDREPNFDSVSFRQDSGSTASTSSVIDVTDQAQREGRLEEVQQFLKEELGRIFSGEVSFNFLQFWFILNSILSIDCSSVCYSQSAGSAMLLTWGLRTQLSSMQALMVSFSTCKRCGQHSECSSTCLTSMSMDQRRSEPG